MKNRQRPGLIAMVALLVLPISGEPEPVASAGETYSNPVTAGVVDTFPDPSTIRGADGDWYAYGTTNPIRHSRGEAGEHVLPVLRSADLVRWNYAGDVYREDDHPAWWPEGTRPFAPDVRYVAGSYHLTYGLSGGGIALATAPSPTGPWTDRGLIITREDGCPTNPIGTIDQAMVTGADGVHYAFWGSYDTMCAARMNADATRLDGKTTIVARGRRAEGALPVRRGDSYYLFYSDAGCCQGAFSGYTVKVGRADNPLGPYRTRDGQLLTDRASKGGIVTAANGNGFVGPGHNTIETDLAGQDWLVYHAIPAEDPDFPPIDTADGVKPSLPKRPMLIDRLDWVDGWPVMRGGAGPSRGPQPAPVTEPAAGSTFATAPEGWATTGDPAARWGRAEEPATGGVLAQSASPAGTSAHLAPQRIGGDLRAEARVRLTGAGESGAVGLVVGERGPADRVTAWIDRAARRLTVTSTENGATTTSHGALPANFSHRQWHHLVVDVRGGAVAARVSEDSRGDALATASVALPGGRLEAGRLGVVSRGTPARADNLSAVNVDPTVPEPVTEPALGEPLPAHSDEFSGTGDPAAGDPAWRWVRGPAPGVVEGSGELTWPTQRADLTNDNNTAAVLLLDAPTGDFVVEAKLGFNGSQPAQQAGMVLYDNDDRYFKLVHSVLPDGGVDGAVFHQTEFTKEAERPTTTPPTPVFNGPMFGGPPAREMWLRLAHHHDPVTGEHEVREASSTDGVHWTWGGTWSMPRGGPLKIGLVSMNSPGATATFDHVRTFRPGA